jgi:hypothetical protein
MKPSTLITASRLVTAVLLAALTWVAATARAATPDFVALSPDITVKVAGTTIEDEEVALDNLLGIVVPTGLGNLPENASVTAYHACPNGDQLFSLDATVELPDSLTARPGDVVRYDGDAYTLEFDASEGGVAESSVADGVGMSSDGRLLLSFDTTTQLGLITVSDEDIVSFNPTDSMFTLVFDGSDAGIAESLDIDGVHDLGNARFALSFDGSGSVDVVYFDDEDVLIYDSAGSSWALVYDGSAQHAGLASADVEAVFVPEPPSGWLLLAAGLGFLVELYRVRARRPATGM